MSFGFLGIPFGFALQNANVSRIFETPGAKVENIPVLWIAAGMICIGIGSEIVLSEAHVVVKGFFGMNLDKLLVLGNQLGNE